MGHVPPIGLRKGRRAPVSCAHHLLSVGADNRSRAAGYVLEHLIGDFADFLLELFSLLFGFEALFLVFDLVVHALSFHRAESYRRINFFHNLIRMGCGFISTLLGEFWLDQHFALAFAISRESTLRQLANRGDETRYVLERTPFHETIGAQSRIAPS